MADDPGSRTGPRRPPKGRGGPLRALAIGALLSLIGVVALILLWGESPPTDASSYRRIDRLVYGRVVLLRGRGDHSIHLVAADGKRYNLPEYVWPEGIGESDLVGTLEADSVATAWVHDGRGYPVVKGLRTSRLFVDPAATVPLDRRRHAIASVGAPVLLLVGLVVAWLGIRGLRARPPFRR